MDEQSMNIRQRVKKVIKSRLIPDWQSRLSDYSTIALASVTALVGVWVLIPDDIKATYSPWVSVWLGKAILGLGVWGTIGKFLVQDRKEKE